MQTSINASALVFSALSDESRLLILSHLRGRKEVVCCEIARAIKKDVSTTFRHLEILARSGLVKTRKEGKYLYCSVCKPKALEKIIATAGTF